MPKVADGDRIVNYIKEYLYSFFTTFVVEKQTIESLRVMADAVSCMYNHPDSFMELSQRIKRQV